MLRRLAGLVDRRARRVVVFAAMLFVTAGAAGAGVASRLDPFGADDPATESVIADQRLEQAGYRETGVVVLVSGVVSRYREEIARSGPGLEAMRRTLATAGRTVLFSSLTVAGALASLLVFPQRFLYSMGIAGFFVALIAAAIALTVLPAILALLGHRVNALAPHFLARRAERDARPAQDGFWYRLAQPVLRLPGGRA